MSAGNRQKIQKQSCVYKLTTLSTLICMLLWWQLSLTKWKDRNMCRVLLLVCPISDTHIHHRGREDLTSGTGWSSSRVAPMAHMQNLADSLTLEQGHTHFHLGGNMRQCISFMCLLSLLSQFCNTLELLFKSIPWSHHISMHFLWDRGHQFFKSQVRETCMPMLDAFSWGDRNLCRLKTSQDMEPRVVPRVVLMPLLIVVAFWPYHASFLKTSWLVARSLLGTTLQ